MVSQFHVNYDQVYKNYWKLSIEYLVRKYFILFGVEFLSDKFIFIAPRPYTTCSYSTGVGWLIIIILSNLSDPDHEE